VALLPSGLLLLLALSALPVPPATAQASPPAPGGGAAPATGAQPGPSPGSPAPPPTAPPFTPPQPPPPSQTLPPSPFTFTPPTFPAATYEFHPTFRLTEEYTDNFLLERDDQRVENFRTTLGAGFNFLVNTAKTMGSLSTDLGFSHDTADEGSDFQLFPSFTGRIRHTIDPRLSLTVSDTLTRSDDFSTSDDTGLRGRERRTFTSNRFTISADWLIAQFATQHYYHLSTFFSDVDTISQVVGSSASTGIGAFTTVSAGYQISHSDTSGRVSRSSTGHTVFGSASRQVGQFGSAGVSSSYTIQSLDDTSIWNVSLFTAYGLPTGLSVSGSVGYSRLSSENRDDRSTFTTNTIASYRFARAVASVGVSQDYRQTFLQGEDTGILLTRTVRASLSFPLTAATGASLSAAYSENEFTGVGNDASAPTTQTVSGSFSLGSPLFSAGIRAAYSENELLGIQQTERAAHTFTAGANVGFQPIRWLHVGLDYSYTQRSLADVSRGEVTENRASITLSAAF